MEAGKMAPRGESDSPSTSNHTVERSWDNSLTSPAHTGEHSPITTSSTHTGDSPAMHFNDLPDIVILRVFSHFSPQKLCTRIAPVCRRWRTVSRAPALWRTLDAGVLNLISAFRLFRTAPLQQLDTLTAGWSSYGGDAFLVLVAEHCPRLRALNLEYTFCVTAEAFNILGASCPHVERLRFTSVELKDGNRSAFESFPNLRSLHVQLTKFSDGDLIAFDTSSCPKLQSVELYLSRFDVPLNVTQLIDRFRKTLVSLCLFHETSLLTDSYLAVALCSQVSVVQIENLNNFSDECIAAFGRLKSLQSLHLCNDTFASDLTSAGLVSAFAADCSFPALKVLRLNFISVVTDDVVVAVANRCPQLSHVALSRCSKVTDRGVCRVVARCSALEELRVRRAKLSSILLWYIPTNLPRLKCIDIESDAMDSASVRELEQAMPELQIRISKVDLTPY